MPRACMQKPPLYLGMRRRKRLLMRRAKQEGGRGILAETSYIDGAAWIEKQQKEEGFSFFDASFNPHVLPESHVDRSESECVNGFLIQREKRRGIFFTVGLKNRVIVTCFNFRKVAKGRDGLLNFSM